MPTPAHGGGNGEADWSHLRLISPQRPRNQTPTPGQDDSIFQREPDRYQTEPEYSHYANSRMQSGPVYQAPQPVELRMGSGVLSPLIGFGDSLTTNGRRRRRPGLRAGMIVASLAIVAVSRLMMGDPGSLLFALRKLVSYGISPDRIIAQLERESISSITDLLRCTDDDLRAAGLKIKEISLIREKRPLIAGELRSTSGSVSPTASGAMGRPGTDDDQEGLGVMLQQEREERRREADAFQSQLVEQTRELQRVVSHLNSTSQEASNQAEISQLRAELEHERAVKNADLERTRSQLSEYKDVIKTLQDTSHVSGANDLTRELTEKLRAKENEVKELLADNDDLAVRNAELLAENDELRHTVRSLGDELNNYRTGREQDLDGAGASLNGDLQAPKPSVASFRETRVSKQPSRMSRHESMQSDHPSRQGGSVHSAVHQPSQLQRSSRHDSGSPVERDGSHFSQQQLSNQDSRAQGSAYRSHHLHSSVQPSQHLSAQFQPSSTSLREGESVRGSVHESAHPSQQYSTQSQKQPSVHESAQQQHYSTHSSARQPTVHDSVHERGSASESPRPSQHYSAHTSQREPAPFEESVHESGQPSQRGSYHESALQSQRGSVHESIHPSQRGTVHEFGEPSQQYSAHTSQRQHESVHASQPGSVHESAHPSQHYSAHTSQRQALENEGSVHESVHPSVHESVHPSQRGTVHESGEPSQQYSAHTSKRQHDSVHASQPGSVHESAHPSQHYSAHTSQRQALENEGSVHESVHPSQRGSARDSVHPSQHHSVQTSQRQPAEGSVHESAHPSQHSAHTAQRLATDYDGSVHESAQRSRGSVHESGHPSQHHSAQRSAGESQRAPTAREDALYDDQPSRHDSTQPSHMPSRVSRAQSARQSQLELQQQEQYPQEYGSQSTYHKEGHDSDSSQGGGDAQPKLKQSMMLHEPPVSEMGSMLPSQVRSLRQAENSQPPSIALQSLHDQSRASRSRPPSPGMDEPAQHLSAPPQVPGGEWSMVSIRTQGDAIHAAPESLMQTQLDRNLDFHESETRQVEPQPSGMTALTKVGSPAIPGAPHASLQGSPIAASMRSQAGGTPTRDFPASALRSTGPADFPSLSKDARRVSISGIFQHSEFHIDDSSLQDTSHKDSYDQQSQGRQERLNTIPQEAVDVGRGLSSMSKQSSRAPSQREAPETHYSQDPSQQHPTSVHEVPQILSQDSEQPPSRHTSHVGSVRERASEAQQALHTSHGPSRHASHAGSVREQSHHESLHAAEHEPSQAASRQSSRVGDPSHRESVHVSEQEPSHASRVGSVREPSRHESAYASEHEAQQAPSRHTSRAGSSREQARPESLAHASEYGHGQSAHASEYEHGQSAHASEYGHGQSAHASEYGHGQSAHAPSRHTSHAESLHEPLRQSVRASEHEQPQAQSRHTSRVGSVREPSRHGSAYASEHEASQAPSRHTSRVGSVREQYPSEYDKGRPSHHESDYPSAHGHTAHEISQGASRLTSHPASARESRHESDHEGPPSRHSSQVAPLAGSVHESTYEQRHSQYESLAQRDSVHRSPHTPSQAGLQESMRQSAHDLQQDDFTRRHSQAQPLSAQSSARALVQQESGRGSTKAGTVRGYDSQTALQPHDTAMAKQYSQVGGAEVPYNAQHGSVGRQGQGQAQGGSEYEASTHAQDVQEESPKSGSKAGSARDSPRSSAVRNSAQERAPPVYGSRPQEPSLHASRLSHAESGHGSAALQASQVSQRDSTFVEPYASKADSMYSARDPATEHMRSAADKQSVRDERSMLSHGARDPPLHASHLSHASRPSQRAAPFSASSMHSARGPSQSAVDEAGGSQASMQHSFRSPLGQDTSVVSASREHVSGRGSHPGSPAAEVTSPHSKPGSAQGSVHSRVPTQHHSQAESMQSFIQVQEPSVPMPSAYGSRPEYAVHQPASQVSKRSHGSSIRDERAGDNPTSVRQSTNRDSVATAQRQASHVSAGSAFHAASTPAQRAPPSSTYDPSHVGRSVPKSMVSNTSDYSSSLDFLVPSQGRQRATE